MISLKASHIKVAKRLFLFVACLVLNVANAVDTTEQKTLILAVHPYLSHEELITRFSPLAAYLANVIGKPIEVRVGRDYAEHIDAIGSDSVGIAYLGPASYVEMVAKYGKKPLLARQVVNGQEFLRGNIIVNQDSSLQTLADLQGKRFAFGDPNSTMTKVPRRMLEDAGVPLSRLNRYDYITGHKNVALAVLAGDFDAGAVKEEVFQEFASNNGLRSLAQTPLIADHVFVTNNLLPTPLVATLRQLLLTLHESAAGTAILTAIHPQMTKLIPAKDSDYNSLRDILVTKPAANGH